MTTAEKSKERVRPGNVIGEASHTTGHVHKVEGKSVKVIEGAHDDGSLKVVAPSGAKAVHNEHKEAELKPGNHRVGKVQEYDYFAEMARDVAD